MSTLLKFISIILVITLVTPVFVGCASSNFKQNSESTADTNNVYEGSEDIIDSKPPENEDLNIISNGKSDYVIVYDSDVEAFETAGLSLSNCINDQFGVSLAVYSDQNVPSNNTKRIIIGDADTCVQIVVRSHPNWTSSLVWLPKPPHVFGVVFVVK